MLIKYMIVYTYHVLNRCVNKELSVKIEQGKELRSRDCKDVQVGEPEGTLLSAFR